MADAEKLPKVRAYLGGRGKQGVELVAFSHAAEHVWAVAPALYPAEEPTAAAWAEPLVAALRDQGPAPVQAALAVLRPPDRLSPRWSNGSGGILRITPAGWITRGTNGKGGPLGRGQSKAPAKSS